MILLNRIELHRKKLKVSSYPPLLPSLGFSDPFDGPGVDFFPFLFVLLHHLLGDLHRPLPVFTLIIQEPLGDFPWVLRVGIPAGSKSG